MQSRVSLISYPNSAHWLTIQAPAVDGISSSTPVTWQTLLWVLITLTCSTMSQPSGRGLGISSKYAMWLRSSPLYCFFDILHIPCRLIQIRIHSIYSSREGLEQLVARRFYYDANQYPERFANSTIARWIFFILGSLGPSIKVFTMTGVPWTQAWSTMFLVSFIVFELLLYLVDRPLVRLESPTTHRYFQSLDQEFKKMEGGLVRLAFFTHLLLLTFAVSSLWPMTLEIFDPQSKGRFELAALRFCLTIWEITMSGVLVWAIWMLFFNEKRTSEKQTSDPVFSMIMILTCVTFSGIIAYSVGWRSTVVDYCIVILSGCLLTLFFGYGRQSALMQQHIEDIDSFYAFLAFVLNLVVVVLWYKFEYDPIGTNNPSWTAIWG